MHMASTTSTPNRKQQKRAGGERRGNNYDRARRRVFLLAWWGDGTTCQCVYCGTTLRDVPKDEQGAWGECHPEHVTADKLEPYEDGPGYVRTNIVPACFRCNNERRERAFDKFAALYGVDAAAIIAHAKASPKRGLGK